jgi:phage protein U
MRFKIFSALNYQELEDKLNNWIDEFDPGLNIQLNFMEYSDSSHGRKSIVIGYETIILEGEIYDELIGEEFTVDELQEIAILIDGNDLTQE